MIDDFEKYQSIALHSLVNSVPNGINIKKLPFSRSAFLLNDSTGLYIKHSSSRLRPWNFGLREMDYLVLRELEDLANFIWVALVCGFEGTVVLSIDEVLKVTDFFSQPEANCRITIRTKRGGSWAVSGNSDELSRMKLKTDPWKDLEI